MFNGGDARLVELLNFPFYVTQKYSKMAEIEQKFKFWDENQVRSTTIKRSWTKVAKNFGPL